jgi:hypothetical protein
MVKYFRATSNDKLAEIYGIEYEIEELKFYDYGKSTEAFVVDRWLLIDEIGLRNTVYKTLFSS